MFNYQNRQYIFRQSGGDTWNFFCDSRQNLCYSTLTKHGIWSNSVVLHKNISPWFYAEMDMENIFHLFIQDNDGNIHYSRLDGQSIKTVPVLNSKVPSVYNKQLYMAPFKNNIYFFYVLQHDNSFMLACQVLSSDRISSPKVVDYVSGSSLPCSILYDRMQNIYAFYQSYDGKYLQLGYRKLSAVQKHWSDFTPVTKYAGNCEYPHAIADDSGVIHICYQRRTPKLFEMVYQQKSPEKNLWTPEIVVHSSVHSFENASILQLNNNSIVVYWVRDDTIYYNTGMQGGSSWGKASRLSFTDGHQLQCICFKANRPKNNERNIVEGDMPLLSPAIYPGSLTNGLKLAFTDPVTADISQLLGGIHEQGNSSGSELKRLVLDSFKLVQSRLEELKDGLSAARDEMTQLSNSYDMLSKEFGKYTIRLNMLESQLSQFKKTNRRQEAAPSQAAEPQTQHIAGAETPKPVKSQARHNTSDNFSNEPASKPVYAETSVSYNTQWPDVQQAVQACTTQAKDNKDPEPLITGGASKKPVPSLDPDKLKEWEEWQEPSEWRESEK